MSGTVIVILLAVFTYFESTATSLAGDEESLLQVESSSDAEVPHLTGTAGRTEYIGGSTYGNDHGGGPRLHLAGQEGEEEADEDDDDAVGQVPLLFTVERSRPRLSQDEEDGFTEHKGPTYGNDHSRTGLRSAGSQPSGRESSLLQTEVEEEVTEEAPTRIFGDDRRMIRLTKKEGGQHEKTMNPAWTNLMSLGSNRVMKRPSGGEDEVDIKDFQTILAARRDSDASATSKEAGSEILTIGKYGAAGGLRPLKARLPGVPFNERPWALAEPDEAEEEEEEVMPVKPTQEYYPESEMVDDTEPGSAIDEVPSAPNRETETASPAYDVMANTPMPTDAEADADAKSSALPVTPEKRKVSPLCIALPILAFFLLLPPALWSIYAHVQSQGAKRVYKLGEDKEQQRKDQERHCCQESAPEDAAVPEKPVGPTRTTSDISMLKGENIRRLGAATAPMQRRFVAGLWMESWLRRLRDWHGLQSLNDRAEDGTTALHIAAAEGNVDMIETMLGDSSFTNANEFDKRGWSALHAAASKGNDEAAKALLSNSRFTVGAAVDKDGRDAASVAEEQNYHSTARAIHCRLFFAYVETKHRLLGGLNARTDKGDTVLHLAAMENSARWSKIDLVTAFLHESEFELPPDTPGHRGRTVLHCAAIHNNVEAARSVLRHRRFTRVSDLDDTGKTALQLADANGQEVQTCKCGNMFMDDSVFCRKCGERRPALSVATVIREYIESRGPH